MKTLFTLLFLAPVTMANQAIDNGRTPEISASLSNEMIVSIGAEDGASHEMLGTNSCFAVSKENHIVVLDPAEYRVLIFNEDGQYQTSFGHKGQGPGEFQTPSEIAIDPQNRVWVFDAGSKAISIFKLDGTWLENRELPPSVVAVIAPFILESGKLVFTAVKLDPNFQQVYVLGTMGKTKASFQAITSLPTAKMDWSKMSEPGFWEHFLVTHFNAVGNGLPIASSLGNQFVVFNTAEFKGTCYSQNGKPLWSMTQQYKPRAFQQASRLALCETIYENIQSSGGPVGNMLNDAVFRSAYKKAELPEFMLPIDTLFQWDQGFGVLTNYDSQLQNGQINLYDKNGVYKYSGTYNGVDNVKLLSGNMLYTSGVNKDDIMTVQKHRIIGLVSN